MRWKFGAKTDAHPHLLRFGVKKHLRRLWMLT
jgi:hypothetical protein